MKNWKTTVTALLTATVGLLTFYAVIPLEAGALFITLGVAIFGLFTKDNDVTGN
jgi:hypothetical protein